MVQVNRAGRVYGRVLAGFVGFLLMAFGGFTGMAIDGAPTVLSMLFGASGVLLFTLATLGPQIRRIEVFWSKIEMRSPDPGELARAIEQIRDEQPDPTDTELPGQADDDADLPEQVWWGSARYLLGEQALMGLLEKLDGPLFGCQARVFLYERNEDLLMPAYRPENGGNPQGWRVGEGVTGAAFQYNEYTYADGDAIREDNWGLSDDVLRRFKDLTAVAAAPLVARDGTTIGVLTLSTKTPAPRLTTPFGRREHLALAQRVSVCLVDLLWGAIDG